MNRTAIALLLSAMLLAGGCSALVNQDPNTGYTFSSPFRKDIRTIAVPIWQRGKHEYRRDIEIRLTEALVKTIEAETPYKVTDKRDADTELTGTLERVDQSVLSFDSSSGQAREVQLRLLVSFTWTDLNDGKVIVEEKKFTAVAEYIRPAPFSEDFFQGSEDAINKIARRIVEKLHQPW